MEARTRRRVQLALPARALAAALVLLVVVAGSAAARWTSGGSGGGTAGTGTAVDLTLAPGTPATQLRPGGRADVVVSIANPNAGPVRVGSLQLRTTEGTAGFAVDAAHSGCATAALSYTSSTNGGAGWTVPGTGSLTVTLPLALTMATTAANACQGATFSIYLRATA